MKHKESECPGVLQTVGLVISVCPIITGHTDVAVCNLL